jgi:hypothetical protein
MSGSIKQEYDEYTEWRNEKGLLHREDGPARVYKNGGEEWWVGGKLHRINGPAATWAKLGRTWYITGKLHRADGPAREYTNRLNEWWVNDNQIKIY